MEKDILKLIKEVDPSNDYEVECVQRVIMTLRAALMTGTAPELVRVVTDFVSGKTLDLMEELVATRNNYPVYE